MTRSFVRNGMRLLIVVGCVVVGGALLVATLGCATRPIEVKQFGNMHEVLSAGASQAHAKITLSEAMERPHAYAVGALAGLSGEVTIIDGQAWLSRPSGQGLDTDGPTSKTEGEAAFLTVAYVDRWQEASMHGALAGADLERFIADQGRGFGIDVDRPFPFVIEGELSDLQAHVINGICPMKPGVRLTADLQPWRYQLERPVRATIVGFYAPDSVGKLTHPGTAVHAHAVFELDGRAVTAHVERLAVAPGAVLRLPDVD